MSRTGETDVLIIGAGPSGLLAGIELARHGVRARVVERAEQPPHQARATAIQPGTLEILSQAGVLDEFLAASMHLRYARILDAALETVAETCYAGTGAKWDFHCSLPQWRTEEILAGRLSELGGVIERGVAAESLQERDDGILVGLEKADGDEETVEARWVIGAGGAHSVTRESMSEDLEGETYPGTALAADVQVSCPLPRDASALIAGPDGYVLLAPLPEERWLTFIGELDRAEAERFEQGVSAEAVADCIERRVPGAIRLTDIAWASPFRMHRRVVSELADGRRFLLGDAGHLSSPFGGEGLNAGLWDGHNLAWKLALELHGRARPGLLDSFAVERGAAAEHVLEVSDRLHEGAHRAVEAARTGVAVSPLSPAQAAALVRSRAMLDVRYPDHSLAGEYAAAGNGGLPGYPAPGDRYPDRITLGGTAHHLLLFGPADESASARLRRRWRGLVEVSQAHGDPGRAGLPSSGLPASGAVLIRPDGFIGFRAAPADAAGLDALDLHLSSYLVAALARAALSPV